MSVPTFSRRKALAVAAMAALTLGAAGAAVAANTGLLGGSNNASSVGNLDAQNVSELLPVADAATDPAQPSVRYVDEIVEVPAPTPVSEAVGGTSGQAVDPGMVSTPAPTSPTPSASVADPVSPTASTVSPAEARDDHGEHEDEHEAEVEEHESHDEHDD